MAVAERKYMERALQLAAHGRSTTSPNPMVGAVIVDLSGRIIGEGWHRRCGEGHAEVNAVASVSDPALLRDATMYVTLEPCSHYGKTPPCAELIIRMGIPRVVVGCLDPFEKVAGRGVRMLREAGVEVVAPFMEEECRALNRRFMTAHTQRRPYVLLKWAQSPEGYLDTRTPSEALLGGQPAKWSTPLTSLLVHILRSQYDAIMVGSGTVLADNPRLTTRLGLTGARSAEPAEASDRAMCSAQPMSVHQPLRVLLDRRGRIPADHPLLRNAHTDEPTHNDTPVICGDHTLLYREGTLSDILSDLYRRGVTSLIVEGGATLLRSFIASGLWDEARIEYGATVSNRRIPHPSILSSSHPSSYPRLSIPDGALTSILTIDGNTILTLLR